MQRRGMQCPGLQRVFFLFFFIVTSFSSSSSSPSNATKPASRSLTSDLQEVKTKTTSATDVLPGCSYGGVLHPAGSKFKPDHCTECACPERGGDARCVVEDCPMSVHCIQLEEDVGARYGTHQGQDLCCAQCSEMGCRHSDGKIYKQGDVIRNEPCARCYCPLGGGPPKCDVTSCPLSECVDPVKVPGVCCPVCPNGPNCQIGLLTLPVGHSVTIEGALCTCQSYTDLDGRDRVLARCNKGP